MNIRSVRFVDDDDCNKNKILLTRKFHHHFIIVNAMHRIHLFSLMLLQFLSPIILQLYFLSSCMISFH